jgi:tetratricopeptide (TPR) repeat protein
MLWGGSYQNNEAYEKAIQTLLEGIKISSHIFSMHNSLGITYRLSAEPDKALIAFLDARDIALSNAFESCDVKKIDGEELSVADNEKISLKLRSNSDWCTVMNNIGMNLLRAGNIDYADNALKESVDFIPSGFDYPGPLHALDYIYSIRKED